MRKHILQIKLLFTLVFYEELFVLIKKGKLSFGHCKEAAMFLYQAILLLEPMKRILKRDRHIGLIYTYWYSFETLRALLFRKYYNNIPVCTRVHGYDLYEFRNDLNYQPYKQWMDKRINRVFFISQDGYDYYLNKFAGCNLQKYMLARLGVINNYSVEVVNNNKDFGIFYMCSCSRIIPLKRIHLIIEALSKIDVCKIHWVHIGNGYDENAIKSMANKILQKKNNISYEFKGFMKNEQVMQFYSKNYFDCFISVSETEGIPVSMMEAISFGIPIIATKVGGVPELVNENMGILLSPVGDVLEIIKAIIDFYNFPEDKKITMRHTARSLWKSDFNAEVNYAKFSTELVTILMDNSEESLGGR